MAIGSGSVGVEDFKDDDEAIKAIRMFPGVMKSYAGLSKDASDSEIAVSACRKSNATEWWLLS